jgi:hypothetical protein
MFWVIIINNINTFRDFKLFVSVVTDITGDLPLLK